MGYKKIDKNQNEIVDALRSAGCSVQSLATIGKGCPDLLVGFNKQNYLLEIKSGKNNLTADQEKWQTKWNGWCYNVRTIEEAFIVIGLIKQLKEKKNGN